MPLLRIDYIIRIVNNKTNIAVHLVLYFSFLSLFALPVVSWCLIKLSFCLTICLSFFLFFLYFLSFSASLCLSVSLLSVCLSVLLSWSLAFYVCLSICLSVFLSGIFSMFVCLPTFLSVCLSLSLYLSPFFVCLSAVSNWHCMPACLSVRKFVAKVIFFLLFGGVLGVGLPIFFSWITESFIPDFSVTF